MNSHVSQALDAAKWFELHREEFVADLCSLINIKSVTEPTETGPYPFGKGCAHVLDRALEIARKAGLQTENDDYHCGSALLMGETEEEIGIFTHLDVVPEGSGWEYEPYHAQERDGFVIGRGSSDNKGAAVCALYTLRYLLETGHRFRHTIRIFFGCNEEAGMQDMDYFLRHHKQPVFSIVPDSRFAVCYGERGILEAVIGTPLSSAFLKSFHAGQVSNMVPNLAEAILSGISEEQLHPFFQNEDCIEIQPLSNGVKVVAHGISAHAADPDAGRNASQKLAAFLSRCDFLESGVRSCLASLSLMFEQCHGEPFGIDYTDEISGRITHAGGLTRFEDGHLTQTINIRYPITMDRDFMKSSLEQSVAGFGFRIESLRDSAPNYVSPDHPAVRLLHDLCNELLEGNHENYVMGGGTYARKLSCAVACGPGVLPRISPFGEARGRGHQPDECVELKVLKNGMCVYSTALPELDRLLGKNP